MEQFADTKKILIVDDCPTDVTLLRQMLANTKGRYNLQLSSVPRLTDAFLRIDREQFDLIIIDPTLSDVTGLDSVLALHSEMPHIPIIAYSGIADPAVKEEALLCGALYYLIKGRENEQSLRHAIESALARRKPHLATTHPLVQACENN